MSDLVAVASFGSHIEADLAKSALEAADIESYVSADDAGGQRPHLAFSGGVVLLVRTADAEAAREVIAGGRAEARET